ncbi:MAG: 1-phosphofructokinase [Desulfobacterales bacterium]|nr:1-phosphofructokinase [Desulfobacterales bacterium]MDD4071539.1 1-phosphofructokinase [Desulfobacterales bacterium]MDD4391825.1 1-phosphofructokinase [Desulfobacterales bacterium]
MIYTVTLNPALDRGMVVEALTTDDTVRAISETVFAAGKGIDVSRVIKELNGQSVTLGFVGGYDGLNLEGLLINAGILTQFTRISGETRINIILKERQNSRQFVISAAGPQVTAAEIGLFYQNFRQISDMTYLVMSGSLPRGVSSNLYGQLILEARKKGAFIVLDTDGAALKESIEYQPTCIKPNQHELSRLVGRPVETESEILAACEQLRQYGIGYILVSRGKNGMILFTEKVRLKAVSPPIEADSTVGAGDSAVAGFVLAHFRGMDLARCLKFACAAGTATAQTPGTELCHRSDVETLMDKIQITSLD